MSDEAMVTENSDDQHGDEGQAGAKITNGCGGSSNVAESDDPANFLLSSKTKLQHMSDEEKEHLNSCLRSRRVLVEEDLTSLSQSIDPKCWKELANSLKFNFMAVEKWEESEETDVQRIHQMLLSWINWKEDKATIGRLAKALFLHDQLEAIECIAP